MGFYKVNNYDWILGGNSGKWYAFRGKPEVGRKADAGPFKTRRDAVRWIQHLEDGGK